MMAPRPPGLSAIPVTASVMNVWSYLGNVMMGMMGPEMSCFRCHLNACRACSGGSLSLYLESFLLNFNRWAAKIAKSLMWGVKKLQKHMKDWMVLMRVGGFSISIALSLFLPSLIPSGARVKPRYETSLFPKTHFSSLIFRWFWCSQVSTCSSTLRCCSWVSVWTSRLLM